MPDSIERDADGSLAIGAPPETETRRAANPTVPPSFPTEDDGESLSSAKARAERVARFSVSLPANLLGELDAMVESRGFPSRSHAIAEMAREQLLQHTQELGSTRMAGTISLVYDYRRRNLQRQLADIQHQNFLLLVASMHVHLEDHQYLEVLLVQGPARDLRHLADSLAGTKGVKHASLNLTSTAIPQLL